MATKKELEIQIEALRKFLTKQRARWEELNPQEQAHYESVDDRLFNLEKELSRIDEIESQPEFRNKSLLRGIGNLALNFLPQLKIFKGLRGPKGNQQGLPSPFYEGEYEILGETDLPSTEGILSLPMGPPAPPPEGYINLPAMETPPPVDFDQPISTFFGASTQNVQNYARWQEKMINELPENATTKQFIANQAEFLEMHTRGLQERFNLNPSQVRRIKINFEDYVGRHWPMFDPSQNTTSTIANRLSEQIEGMADTLVKQAANVGIASLADMRFEAVATDPDYALENSTQQPLVPVTQVQSDIQELEKVIEEKFGKDPVFTPEIDPVFLSTSPLREHLNSKHFSGSVGKGDLDPATVLDELGIALTDTGVGFKDKSKKGRLSNQVIDSGIANLLRNRIRDNATVTKEELIRVLDHHRGQFSTEITFGNETEFQGRHYSDSGGTSLLTLAKGIGHNSAPTKEDIFEIVSKYNPVLEEGGELGSSPFSLRTGGSHGWASDDIGDQHFWLRGDVLEYADGLKGGSVAEIQSDMGWAESPEHPEYAWLSDMTTTESEEITDIQNRQEIFEQAYEDARVEEIGTIAGDRHIGKGIVDGIRDIASGNFPLTYNDLESWIEPMGRLLSKTNAAFAEEFKALHDKVKESAINRWGIGFDSVLLDKQPFAKEFGIELTKEDVDIPLSDIVAPRVPGEPYGTGLGEALDFSGGYTTALRSRLLKKYPHDFGDIPPAFQNGMLEVDHLMLEQYRFAMDENASDFYKLFTKEAIAPVLKDFPDLQKLYDLGSTAPTEAELKKLTEYQDQQVDVTALADFPMKKTYPRYGARSLIEKGLAQGWDTVEVSDLPPGQKGSVENYPKAVQELKNIAKTFKLPLETRAATMLTATGEKGRGMAERLVTFYRLDIRPLRALIEAEEFGGLGPDLKHGGLVTKAQGAGYNMNYGDYGRSYT
jgi:hypothetical protein